MTYSRKKKKKAEVTEILNSRFSTDRVLTKRRWRSILITVLYNDVTKRR